MFFSKYLIHAAIIFVWGVLVMLIFKFVPDRFTAANIAGVGFFVLPVYLLFDGRMSEWHPRIYYYVILIFLLTCSLPILAMRNIYSGEDFNSLALMGVPMALIHKISSYIYMAMFILSLWSHSNTKHSG